MAAVALVLLADIVLVGRVPAGEGPAGVAATGRAYVANQFSGTVTVIEGEKAVAHVKIKEGVWGLGADEAANEIWVADFFGTNVYVVDGKTNKVGKPIPVGVRTSSVAVGRKKVYFGSSITPRIVVVDKKRRKRVDSINLTPHRPADIALDPAGRLYFVSFGPKSVLGRLHGKTVELPGNAMRLAVDARRIYVPVEKKLLVFDHALKQVASVPLPDKPGGIAVDGDRVYVALRDAGELAVFEKLELVQRVEAGARSPLDVAVRKNRIYVSMRTAKGKIGSVAIFEAR